MNNKKKTYCKRCLNSKYGFNRDNTCIDDRYFDLLIAIIKQAVSDYIHCSEGSRDYISAKEYLDTDCFGFLDSELYMEELDRQRKEYWKARV